MKRIADFTTLATAIGLSLALTAGAALADGRGGPHEMRRHGGFGPKLIETFDANGDGKLTQAEIDGERGQRLTRFDADKDGTLTLSEYQALWLEAMRERMVDRFQRLDADGDGKVTTEEFEEPFSRIVARLDRNDDGFVSRDEMRPRHQGRHDGKRHMHGGRVDDKPMQDN